jgi:hypothetical protein
MRIVVLLLVLISSPSFCKGSSHSGSNCYPSPTERAIAAEKMKYDRCTYKRVGDDLVGRCWVLLKNVERSGSNDPHGL